MGRLFALVIAIGLVVLAISNPGMDDFKSFVEQRSEYLLRQETGDTALGRALSGAGSELAGAFVDRVSERENYLVCSIYTIDADRDDAPDWRFLGLGGRFFQLKDPNSNT